MPTPISNTGAPATLPAETDPIGPPPPPTVITLAPVLIVGDAGAMQLVKQNEPSKALPPPCTEERNKAMQGAVSVVTNALTTVASRGNPLALVAGLINTFEASYKEGAALRQFYECTKK